MAWLEIFLLAGSISGWSLFLWYLPIVRKLRRDLKWEEAASGGLMDSRNAAWARKSESDRALKEKEEQLGLAGKENFDLMTRNAELVKKLTEMAREHAAKLKEEIGRLKKVVPDIMEDLRSMLDSAAVSAKAIIDGKPVEAGELMGAKPVKKPVWGLTRQTHCTVGSFQPDYGDYVPGEYP